MNKIEELESMIKECNNIVAFTGAGVSTASGLKDFRSKDGIYHLKLEYDESPEYMLSHECFYDNTDMFYDFYKKYMNCNVEPNITHKYLKKLEDTGKLKAIVTQNIDGLHTKAGSTNVLEIHGTIYKNYCMECGKKFKPEDVFNSKGVPRCECGGIIRPEVTLYGEMIPPAFDEAIKAITYADTLIVAGTSLMVYPAANLVRYFGGKHLILINKDKTQYDDIAEITIHGDMKDIFNKLK
jgi:NAD-dependent deacetylase